jgi:hypothetical protein
MIVYQDMDYGPPVNKKSNTGATLNNRANVANPPPVTQAALNPQAIAEMIDSRINTKLAAVVHETDQKIKAAVDPLSTKIDLIDSTINTNIQSFTATINQNITDTITEMFQALGVHHTSAGLITPPSNLAPVATSNRYAALSTASSSYKSPRASSTNGRQK